MKGNTIFQIVKIYFNISIRYTCIPTTTTITIEKTSLIIAEQNSISYILFYLFDCEIV